MSIVALTGGERIATPVLQYVPRLSPREGAEFGRDIDFVQEVQFVTERSRETLEPVGSRKRRWHL
jgi:hypothetical protein